MAVITDSDLYEMLKNATRGTEVNGSSDELKAALQAIENTFEGARSAINSSINTATSPTVLSVDVKKKLVAYYLFWKFGQELL